ncbi:MAG: TonB-dependent receptor [Candidatus Zixiibacteriota bacterium]
MRTSARILLLIGIFVWLSLNANGQTNSTGVLRGEIKSYETEELLPGANIAISGTEFGMAADQNGSFSFTGVPPGVYEIDVSLIGYLKTKRTNVEVKPGQETKLSIKLRSSPIILEKGVKVVGERPMVDIKLPSTKRELTSNDLETSPATDFKDVVSQQVGVIRDKSELHIRGGRSYENLFLIDELPINDPFTRSGYGVSISPSAIQELDLLSGGLNAEYGQVTAGVVEMEIKEGGEKLEGSLTYKTDDLGFRSSSNFNTDICDFSLSGPVDFFKSGLSKVGLKPPGDFYFFADGNFDFSDTELKYPGDLFSSSFGKRKFAPRQDNRLFGVFKLTWKDPSFKCSFALGKSVVINQDKSVLLTRLDLPTYSYGPPFAYSRMLSRYDTFTQESNFQLLSCQKIMGEKNLFSVSLSRYFTNLHADVNGMNWSSYTMPLDAYPFEIALSPDSTHYDTVKAPDGFYDQGDGDTWYDHYVETYRISSKLTRVMSDLYTIQAGFSQEYQTIQLLDVYEPWLGSSGLGFSYDRYRVYSNDGALFWENDLKLEKAIVNLGLRYDYWFPGEYVERAMQDTSLHFITAEMRNDFEAETFRVLGHRGKGNLSPRFGFSAPFGNNSSFFFNYGRLSRRPNPQYLYAKLYSNAESSYQLWGNPNLNSEKVISYEVGTKSMPSENDALSIVVYYRSILDYITAARVVPDTLKPEQAYLIYFNLDFATSRGVEIEYKRKVGDFFNGSVQVGFSKTSGERSDPEDILKGIGGRSTQKLYEEHVFDWDKPWQVVTRASFLSQEKRLRLFGWRLPPQWDLNLSLWAHSGERYTPYKETISPEGEVGFVQDGDINSKIGKFWSSLDLSFRKHFYWKDLKYSLVLEVTNLLDHKNAVIINPLTGDAYEKNDIVPYGEGDPNLPEKGTRLPLWDDPSRFLGRRNLKVGISVNW